MNDDDDNDSLIIPIMVNIVCSLSSEYSSTGANIDDKLMIINLMLKH
jgi:hypothetical protein